MRPLAFLLFFLTGSLFAQEQERKLIDRLLRPDTELQNPAQAKAFQARAGGFAGKEARVRALTVKKEKTLRTFAVQPEFTSRQHAAFLFRDGSAVAHGSTRAHQARELTLAQERAPVRAAAQGERSQAVRSYGNTRPFLGEGKSQKALSQKDTPLTIDQVRELLNKSK